MTLMILKILLEDLLSSISGSKTQSFMTSLRYSNKTNQKSYLKFSDVVNVKVASSLILGQRKLKMIGRSNLGLCLLKLKKTMLEEQENSISQISNCRIMFMLTQQSLPLCLNLLPEISLSLELKYLLLIFRKHSTEKEEIW